MYDQLEIYAGILFHCLKAKGDGSHGDVLKKIVKCLNNSDVFEKDFPFYIILAYRIRVYVFKSHLMAEMLTVFIFRNRIYKCDDSPQFFTTIIDKMETLDPLKLCSTLNAFFQRSDSLIAYSVGVNVKLQNSWAML